LPERYVRLRLGLDAERLMPDVPDNADDLQPADATTEASPSGLA
jgi:hypothetical protein